MFRIAFFALIFSLVGCERNDIQSQLVSLGLLSVTASDLDYTDEALSNYSNYLYQLAPSDKFLLDEYKWIKNRNKNCDQARGDAYTTCVKVRNDEHVDLHIREIFRILVAKQSSIANPNLVNLPEEMKRSARTKRDSFTSLDYSNKSGILAFSTADDLLYVADTVSGELLLGPLEPSIPSERFTENISISENGELVAVSKKNYVDVYSSRFGFLSRYDNTYYSQFIGSQYLALMDSNGISIIDLALGEVLVNEASLKPNRRSGMRYLPSKETLIAWKESEQKIFTYSINVSRSFDEFSPKIHRLPRDIGDIIQNIVVYDDQVVIVGHTSILGFNIDDSSIKPIAKRDLIRPNNVSFATNEYLIYFDYVKVGRMRNYVLKVLNITTGLEASIPGFEKGIFSVAATNSPSKILIGSRTGIEEYEFNPKKLVFVKSGLDINKPKGVDRYVITRSVKSKTAKPTTSRGTIVKCVDPSGRVSFSDSKCDQGANSNEVDLNISSINLETQYEEPVKVEKGEKGIQQALARGLIRTASDRDLSRWKQPRSTSTENSFLGRDIYVALKPVEFSGGFGGANAKVFLAHADDLKPAGDIGHSITLFSSSGACLGVLCTHILR